MVGLRRKRDEGEEVIANVSASELCQLNLSVSKFEKQLPGVMSLSRGGHEAGLKLPSPVSAKNGRTE
jgi:hypothetical protein